MSRAHLLDVAKERVVVFDGAMGTSIHGHDLSLADYDNHENCVDIVTLTRPDVVLGIHRSFLAVGCDAVLTNTFGANKVVFSEFGIAQKTYEVNKRAAELAKQACAEFDKPSQPRFAVGSMGPGMKLPSLLQTTWDELVDSYTEQARGLIDGGVDAITIETCQDILQAKAAIVAATDAMIEKRTDPAIAELFDAHLLSYLTGQRCRTLEFDPFWRRLGRYVPLIEQAGTTDYIVRPNEEDRSLNWVHAGWPGASPPETKRLLWPRLRRTLIDHPDWLESREPLADGYERFRLRKPLPERIRQ